MPALEERGPKPLKPISFERAFGEYLVTENPCFLFSTMRHFDPILLVAYVRKLMEAREGTLSGESKRFLRMIGAHIAQAPLSIIFSRVEELEDNAHATEEDQDLETHRLMVDVGHLLYALAERATNLTTHEDIVNKLKRLEEFLSTPKPNLSRFKL